MLGMISLTKVMPHICVLSSAPFQILLAFYFLYQMVRLTKLCQITLIYQIMHHIAVLVICSKHHECAMVHYVQDDLDFVDGCQAGVKMIIQGDHLASALAQ